MNYTAYITPAAGVRLTQTGTFVRDTEERENDLIQIFPEQADQVWEGFGGAVTDSSAYVWSQLPPELQQQVLNGYFTPDGLGYAAVRVPIDSCDFSLEPYEAAPDGKTFDMTRPFRYILPMLEAIREKRDVSLMLSPWSPPAAFKTNGSRQHGGACAPAHWDNWAEYICRYIREFTNRGFYVKRLSLQNEPHAVQQWDSCVWSAPEEREFLVRCMKPALERHGLHDVEIYIWDHNKERILERSLAVLDKEGRGCADGVAFHWYSGDHFEALRRVHELFPEKKLILSENCIEYSKFAAAAPGVVRTMIAHEIIGDLESGANAFFDWNLLLDENGGPNYVGNFCQAPMQYDARSRNLKRQGSWDALWHFSHFLTPGSRRVLTSVFSSDLEKTAFRRSDGAIVLFLLNRGRQRKAFLRLGERIAPVLLPEKALITILIKE